MSRAPKNQLTIEPLPGGFRMFGYVQGQKIRRWNKDLSILEAERDELLAKAADVDRLSRKLPQMTWLTTDQIRDAEAMFHEFRTAPRPLIEYLRAGHASLGSGAPVACELAIEQWKVQMRDEEKLFPRSVASNVKTAERFTKHAGVKFLHEITNAQIEQFSALANISSKKKGKGPSMSTKVSRAARVRAFLTFCVRRKWLQRSPFEMEMDKLQAQATKLKARPMILSPEQCEALLNAALRYDPRFVPFVILTTWCFMRRAEACRCIPEDVKFGNKIPIVELFPRKNGTAAYRTVTIPANVLPLLKECVDSGLWVKGTEVFFKEGSWKTLRAEAGIIKLGPRNAKGYRAVIDEGSHWQENIQRHAGISYLFKLTGDMKEVTRQAGNSDDTAFKHYLNIPKEGDAEKFYAITGTLKKEVAQDAHIAA